MKEEPDEPEDVEYSEDSADDDPMLVTPVPAKKANKQTKKDNKSKLSTTQPSTSTPKLVGDAAKYSLLLDSSDDEIQFDTPPLTEKKSKTPAKKSRLNRTTDSEAAYKTADDTMPFVTPEERSFVKKTPNKKKLKPRRALKA